eukprot:Hpha_TRINITY_DN16697_c0_g2::TRINITY_DN16697_c0_g2_i1::g.182586::m.182586
MPRKVSQDVFEGAAGASTDHMHTRAFGSSKQATNPVPTPEKAHRGRGHAYGEEHLSRPVHDGEMQEGVFCGKAKVQAGPNKERHFNHDFTTASEDFERVANAPRRSPEGVDKYGSVCPWQPRDHPEKRATKSRGFATLPERRQPRRSKSPGLAPSWPGHQAADGPVPNRFPLDKNGVPNATLSGPRRRTFHDQGVGADKESNVSDVSRAGRKYFEPTASPHREFTRGGRQPPSNLPTTSIFGRDEPSAARGRSVSPDRFRFQAPYSEHTREPGSAANRSASADAVYRGRARVDGRSSFGPKAPYDLSGPQEVQARASVPDTGAPRSYKPATRMFSQQPGATGGSTHERIWG